MVHRSGGGLTLAQSTAMPLCDSGAQRPRQLVSLPVIVGALSRAVVAVADRAKSTLSACDGQSLGRQVLCIRGLLQNLVCLFLVLLRHHLGVREQWEAFLRDGGSSRSISSTTTRSASAAVNEAARASTADTAGKVKGKRKRSGFIFSQSDTQA